MGEPPSDPLRVPALAVELLARGRAVRFSAPGGSMRPTIGGGEIITVEPIAPSAIAAGDIILFRREARLVAHRVIRVAGECGSVRFLTRGDAAAAADPPVEASAVLGRVVAVERGGRCIDLTGPRSIWSGRLARCLTRMRLAVRRARSALPG